MFGLRERIISDDNKHPTTNWEVEKRLKRCARRPSCRYWKCELRGSRWLQHEEKQRADAKSRPPRLDDCMHVPHTRQHPVSPLLGLDQRKWCSWSQEFGSAIYPSTRDLLLHLSFAGCVHFSPHRCTAASHSWSYHLPYAGVTHQPHLPYSGSRRSCRPSTRSCWRIKWGRPCWRARNELPSHQTWFRSLSGPHCQRQAACHHMA